MKKAFITIGVLLVVCIGAIIILPVIFKDKIVALVKTEINNNLNAKADFKNFDLSLLSSFPDFTLTLENFSIIGIQEFEGDTLVYIPQFKVSVNLMSVIGGKQLSIKTINLDQPYINLLVLKNGKSNWDISKPTLDSTATPSTPSAFKVSLKKYAINKGRINYHDESLGFKMAMDDFNHSGKGDFTQDLFTLATNTAVTSTNVWYGGVKYMHHIRTALKADLEMDMKNMKFTFKENELSLNELVLGFDGWIAMPTDDIKIDLSYTARQNDFRNFISMVPGVYSENFKDLQSKGSLSLKGFVKGIYSEKQMPGFGLIINIKDGMFRYPSLPIAVNNVQVDLDISNPDGVPDHTAIDLHRMHVDLGTEPFDARLRVRTPISDADMEGMLKGSVNLANISKIVPLDNGTSISGLLVTNLGFKGRMSAIEQKKYENFDAAGSLSLSNFNYTSKDYKQEFDLKQCSLTFNPKNVTLEQLDAKMGKSDIKANGTIDNLLPYVFKNEVLKGSMTLNANYIDLNDLMGNQAESPTTTVDTAAVQLLEVPANIDFTLYTNIGKVIYDNLILENVKGSLQVKEATTGINNLSFNTLGGNIVLNGSYATPNHKNANMKFVLNVKDCDIQQTVKTFSTIKKMAAIVERCNGKYSTSLSLNGTLDQKMDPIMNSLNGMGTLQTGDVSVTNFGPLVKMAETLKMEQFKQVNLSNLNFSFNFADGRIYIKPFATSLAGFKTKIEGSNGFDQTIDYKLNIDIPTSQLPSAATSVMQGILFQANSKGANLSMGEKINIDILMGGTIDHPEIKTGMKGTSGKIVDQLKDKVRDELDKRKKELQNKAHEEADRLKKEAEDKANAEVDRLKKEVEAKAKAEADKLKKEAENKAKNAVKKLFK